MAVLVLAGLVGAAQGTILPKIEFSALCRDSARIVRALCTSSYTHWDEGRTMIFTSYEFTPLESLKGGEGGTLTVRSPGGIVGDRGFRVAGAPAFVVGEEYVLFLRATPDGGLDCLGWTQGVYKVERDDEGKVPFVRADTTGAGLLGPGKGASIQEGGPTEAIPLAEFLRRVREQLSGGAPAAPSETGETSR